MTLYTQDGCAMCALIKDTLQKKNIEYSICTDIDTILNKGINHVPVLELEDGRILASKELFEYVNSLKEAGTNAG